MIALLGVMASAHVLSKESTGQDRVEFKQSMAPVLEKYCHQCHGRQQTKGKVESGVKYVKRNALVGRRFASWDALNGWLEQWALTIADE